jgi:tetratricopeptide (TPR) repeat protein
MENVIELAVDNKNITASAQYLYGLFYELIDCFDESATAYRRAIDLNPRAFAPWHGLGNLLAESLHRYDEAEAAYRRAIDLDPKASGPWNGLGNLLRSFRRCAEALESYGHAVQLKKDTGIPTKNRASLFWNIGRFDAARSEAATALEVSNHSHTALSQRITLELALWLDDTMSAEKAEKLRVSAGAHKGDFSTVFGLFLHSLVTGIDINIHCFRVIEQIHSYSNRLMAIEGLYDLSGWRPDCRQAAKEVVPLFYNLPAEVIARFKDVPTPEFLLNPFIPFLEGRSDGAGDPRDLPLLCEDTAPSTVQG